MGMTVWREFIKYYGFIEFNEGIGVRCGVIPRDVFKYDYPQIAHVLSITPQEVQKIVAQGRQRLGACSASIK